MNKEKILEYVEKDFLTLVNLERSMKFAINSKGKQYQFKVMHAAFKRTCDCLKEENILQKNWVLSYK